MGVRPGSFFRFSIQLRLDLTPQTLYRANYGERKVSAIKIEGWCPVDPERVTERAVRLDPRFDGWTIQVGLEAFDIQLQPVGVVGENIRTSISIARIFD